MYLKLLVTVGYPVLLGTRSSLTALDSNDLLLADSETDIDADVGL